MARNLVLLTVCLGTLVAGCQSADTMFSRAAGWHDLFNGENLDGWKKATESPETFSVQDGEIVAHGERCHLFYVGPVHDANFTNFEFKADVLTKPGSNSGIYFHTAYQPTGWPSQGYECQVNQTYQPDPKKTGGLYNIVNIDAKDNPAKDNEWYTQEIIVHGKHIVVNIVTGIDGPRPTVHKVVDYTEPDELGRRQPRLSSGTFALQGHDPGSEVHFKNIKVRPLR
ncbi:MAG: DUF1080 domain-containing protein [Sedimentisphaerales bacterium]|nr:DUF1080 domain-containing protein [Sedimentisphaerales bacterium]